MVVDRWSHNFLTAASSNLHIVKLKCRPGGVVLTIFPALYIVEATSWEELDV
jgi:hypothetical protein